MAVCGKPYQLDREEVEGELLRFWLSTGRVHERVDGAINAGENQEERLYSGNFK